jgi:hypothetical protein
MKFEIIKKLRFEDFASRESGYQAQHGRSILASALVRCPCCGHEWETSAGGERGEFLPGSGSLRPISCPECPCEGTVSIS